MSFELMSTNKHGVKTKVFNLSSQDYFFPPFCQACCSSFMSVRNDSAETDSKAECTDSKLQHIKNGQHP